MKITTFRVQILISIILLMVLMIGWNRELTLFFLWVFELSGISV